MSGSEFTLDHRLALRALTNGKAPPALHEDLFVGRATELALFDSDLEIAAAGGASIRIIVGEPGAGKTMLQHAMAARARSQGFVTTTADLAPDRLLHGRAGEGRALLRETVLAMHTAATGDELTVDAIVSRFGNDCQAEARLAQELPRKYTRTKLNELHAKPKGAEFAHVIEEFAFAPEQSSGAANCRRWLCGDYTSVADARVELRIASLIEDQDFWAMQKLWGAFLRLAGRPGLALFLDEAQVLCGLHNPNARMLNLEQLLLVFNDILQGRAQGIAIVIAATPAFVGQWNGLAKHEGLSSCLSGQDQTLVQIETDNALVHLNDFEESELLDLLQRCRQLYATCRPGHRVLPDESLQSFLETCRNQIGNAYWQLPRRVIQRFFAVHDRLAANPSLSWEDLLFPVDVAPDADGRFDGYAQRQI